MKITSINVKPLHTENERVLARISMTVDGAIALRGMALIKRDDGTTFLSMPTFMRGKDNRTIKPCFPITNEARLQMQEAAQKAYEQAQSEADKQDNYIYDFDEADGLGITEIRVNPTKTPGIKTKAFVSMVLDGALVLNDMRLMERQDGTLFLSMPNFPRGKSKDAPLVNVYHPITADVRAELMDMVTAEYQKVSAEKAA